MGSSPAVQSKLVRGNEICNISEACCFLSLSSARRLMQQQLRLLPPRTRPWSQPMQRQSKHILKVILLLFACLQPLLLFFSSAQLPVFILSTLRHRPLREYTSMLEAEKSSLEHGSKTKHFKIVWFVIYMIITALSASSTVEKNSGKKEFQTPMMRWR